MKMEKLNGELRKFISLGRKILTLQIDPLPCEHPLKSSVPFRSGPFRSVPFSCERGLRIPVSYFISKSCIRTIMQGSAQVIEIQHSRGEVQQITHKGIIQLPILRLQTYFCTVS